MTQSNRNIIIVVLHAVFIASIFLFLSKANNHNYLPEQQNVDANYSFDLKSRLKGINHFDANSFPSKNYLDSGNFKNVECLITTLNILDSITKDNSVSQKILATILTDSLLNRDEKIYSNCNLDKLISLMQWVERYQYYAEIDERHRLFFTVIYDFWMNYISEKLASYSKDSSSIKYAFKYKFLVGKCSERKYTVGVKVTSTEKVIDNLVRSQWAHLYDASWNQSTLLMKFIFVFFIFVFIYGIICIIQKHSSNEKKVISS